MATFDDCVTSLMLSNPFFSQLLMRLNIEPDDSIGTCAVSINTLYYSPAFFAKLDVDEGVFAIAHEVQHCILQHVEMLHTFHRTGIGPDGKEFRPNIYAAAIDYVVNAACVENGFKKIRPEVIELYLDQQRFPSTMLVTDIYDELAKQKVPPPGAPLDDHKYDPTEVTQAPAISATDVVAAAGHHKAMTGKYPAGIERLIEAFQKPVVSPWTILRRFVCRSLPGRDQSTWKRFNRSMLHRGIYTPGRNGAGVGRVGVVNDTSGSIGDAMLARFAGHMAAIIDEQRPKDVMIYWVDAEVAGTGRVRTGSELRAFVGKGAKGGGGTNMVKGVEAATADKCDVIVVLTDGYTPFGSPSKTPVLWAITTAIEAPHGTTIHI